MIRITTAVAALVLVVVTGGAGTSRAALPTGSATAVEAKGPSYPSRVSSTGRYLVDGRGRPFMIVGDSPQSLMVNLSLRDADRYFAVRQAQGFNSVWVNLVCNTYTGGRADETTYDGIAPFTSRHDLAKPNEAYFRRVDAMLRLARKHGITVFLDPMEVGGWIPVLIENGAAKDYAYGQFLGRRYASFPNIVWFNGNDFQAWRDGPSDEVALAVARGIKSTDPAHLQTVELDFPTSGSLDDSRWRDVISLDGVYTYYPTYAQFLREYARPRHLPTFLIESSYEDEHDYTGPETLRRQEYWTMLSGATGQLYGSKYTWPFLKGWQSHLRTKPVTELGYMLRLFADKRWFELVPDRRHALVTAGFGRYATTGTVNDSDYVTAARTPDGKLAIAYLPTPRGIAVNLSRLAGRVTARWYDPTTGRYSSVRGSPFRNRGKRVFTPTGPNGNGDGDWVLVLSAK